MQPLSFWLEQCYPYTVVPDPDGGCFITYPDLPGCITQVDLAQEIGPAAEEIRVLWIETAHDLGMEIVLPQPHDRRNARRSHDPPARRTPDRRTAHRGWRDRDDALCGERLALTKHSVIASAWLWKS